MHKKNFLKMLSLTKCEIIDLTIDKIIYDGYEVDLRHGYGGVVRFNNKRNRNDSQCIDLTDNPAEKRTKQCIELLEVLNEQHEYVCQDFDFDEEENSEEITHKQKSLAADLVEEVQQEYIKWMYDLF